MSNPLRFLQLDTLEGVSDKEGLNLTAKLIDHAGDKQNSELANKALRWCADLKSRTLSSKRQALIEYYEANAWAVHQQLGHRDEAAKWAWEQKEIQQQILCLRRAKTNLAFKELNIVRQCQILTNLANQLDYVGRFVEAQSIWREALVLCPEFWMARANMGEALVHYGRALYSRHDQAIFAFTAYNELTTAIQDLDRNPYLGVSTLRSRFSEAAEKLDQRFHFSTDKTKHFRETTSLGRGHSERRYRQWCQKETLFLNPVNDIGGDPISAGDVLTLPTFRTSITEGPVLIGFFNQLKQEFVSARWLYFEGIISEAPHLSDRKVLLFDTLDYPNYGLAIEKTKIAFRMTYSLFDKISYFLNKYLSVGLSEKDVSFQRIWKEKNKALRPIFLSMTNWPFRGLYWLSKDLFEEGYREAIEPDSFALYELRNHLEHKYVKVHNLLLPRKTGVDMLDTYFDDFAYSIMRDDLGAKTLRLLKLARSALIYLSLGMHREEQQRAQKEPHSHTIPMTLDYWDEKLKGRW